jgi:hypothetical protein
LSLSVIGPNNLYLPQNQHVTALASIWTLLALFVRRRHYPQSCKRRQLRAIRSPLHQLEMQLLGAHWGG